MTTSGLLKWGNLETRIWQVSHRYWYELWHRRRIGLFRKIPFIPAQSERPIAKDAEPFCRRFNARHWQTFYDLGMFMPSTVEASVFMGKNCSDNFHSIKNTTENLTLMQMFEISEQLILEQSDGIFAVSQISWEILHDNSCLWSMMRMSSVSRMQRFMYFQILCYVLGR